ncbi:MAG: hypothetical protein R2813_01160 [Flavobacteriales bacterium]
MFEKINQYVMFAFMAIGIILMIMTMGIEVPAEGECLDCGVVGSFIGMSYILLIIAILAALAGTVMTALSNPGKMKGTAIGVGAMLVITGISYGLASGEVLESYGDVSESASRWSGAGLYMFYILLVLAVLSIAYSSVSRLMK